MSGVCREAGGNAKRSPSAAIHRQPRRRGKGAEKKGGPAIDPPGAMMLGQKDSKGKKAPRSGRLRWVCCSRHRSFPLTSQDRGTRRRLLALRTLFGMYPFLQTGCWLTRLSRAPNSTDALKQFASPCERQIHQAASDSGPTQRIRGGCPSAGSVSGLRCVAQRLAQTHQRMGEHQSPQRLAFLSPRLKTAHAPKTL